MKILPAAGALAAAGLLLASAHGCTRPSAAAQAGALSLQYNTGFEVAVWRDPATSCEYLVLMDLKAMTPRLMPTGKIYCGLS